MASTVFQDFNQNTPIVSAWLNDVNKGVYSPGGVPKVASLIPAAWVRFSVNAGIVAVQQSVNVLSVVRTSTGVFQVTYNLTLTNSQNCYQILQNASGFISYINETQTSVTFETFNTSNVLTDPGSCCVTIFGAN